MADEVSRLAYDEARATLRNQDATLASVRNRATALVAAAAVSTSVSVTAGLLDADARRGRMLPEWAGWTLLTSVGLITVGVMAVLWPIRAWSYGPSPATLAGRAGTDIDEVLHLATGAMVDAVAANELILSRRMMAYRVSAILLMLQIALLVAALLVVRR